MRFRRFMAGVGVLAVSAAWYVLMIPWSGFSDPDAFYHAKMSLLLLQNGSVTQFPWLDLTLLGSHFADLHFGFHVFVAPFVAVLGLYTGLRVATVILSVLCILAFYGTVRWLGLRYAYVWSGFLLFSYGFGVRTLLGKATPLAVTLFLLGVVAAWKRHPWLLGVITAVYALSHGGWPYLAGTIVLLAIGDIAYRRLVDGILWKDVVSNSMWREIFAALFGALFGLTFHPNFPQIFVFAWTQIVTIGLQTPFNHVVLGSEWLPADLSSFVVTMAPWIIALVLGCAGLFLAIRKPLDTERARFVVAWGIVLAVFVALTFKSRRNLEFLVPVATLWCAALWSLVDVKKFREELTRKSIVAHVAIPIVMLCLVGVFGKQVWETWKALHPPRYQDTTAYAESMAAISSRAKPGDRVFHTSWDEFPILFVRDDRLRYVAGLDPTFLYVASSTLSDAYRDLTWDVTSSTHEQAWPLIHDQLEARFIFVSRKNHGKFLDLISKDTRFVQIASSTDSVAFETK